MNGSRFARAAAALAVAAVALAAAPVHALPSAPVGPQYDATATTRLLAEVNAHRVSIGLHALALDGDLADIAKAYTLAMATKGTLAHNDALFTPETHHALGISILGENVGDTWAPDRFEPMFLASPHHRENMESPAYAVAGFAVFVDPQGQYWATEDFGSAPHTRVVAAAPAPAPAPRRVAAPAPARRAPAPVHHVAVRRVAAPVRHVVASARVVTPPRTERAPVVNAVPSAAVAPAAPSRTLPAVVAFVLVALVASALLRRRARLAA